METRIHRVASRSAVEMLMKYCYNLRILEITNLGISAIDGDSIPVITIASSSGLILKILD